MTNDPTPVGLEPSHPRYENPGAGKILKVLTIAMLTVFLFFSCIVMFAAEGYLMSLKDGDIASEEIAKLGNSKLKHMRDQLTAIRIENESLKNLAEQRRKNITTNGIPSKTVTPTGDVPATDSAPFQRRTLAKPDKVSRFVAALVNRDLKYASSVAPLNEDGDHKKVIEALLAVYPKNLVSQKDLAELVEFWGNDEQKQKACQLMLEDFAVQRYEKNRDWMLPLVTSLPEKQRPSAVSRLLGSIPSSSTSTEQIKAAVDSVPSDQMPLLSLHLAHPNTIVRAAILERMTESQQWTAMLEGLNSRDYARFSVALNWLVGKPAEDEHRQQVLEGLRDVLWYRTGEIQHAFAIFTGWVNLETIEMIYPLLAVPDLPPATIGRLLSIPLHFGDPNFYSYLPPKTEAQLMVQYLRGQKALSKSVTQMLASGNDKAVRMRWINRICLSGGNVHEPAIAAAVEQINKTDSGSVFGTTANQLLSRMRRRLGIKP